MFSCLRDFRLNGVGLNATATGAHSTKRGGSLENSNPFVDKLASLSRPAKPSWLASEISVSYSQQSRGNKKRRAKNHPRKTRKRFLPPGTLELVKRRAPVQKKLFDQQHAAALAQIDLADINLVFDHWVKFHWSGSGRRPVLTAAREATIRRGVFQWGLKRCLDAIEGVQFSEWHMGGNPAGIKYTSLDLILREEWRVNKFARSLAFERKNGYTSP